MKLNNKISYISHSQLLEKQKLPATNLERRKQTHIDTQEVINNGISRPAKALSFSGSAISMSEKFVKSKAVNKLTKFVNDNEAAYNAIYALLIAGIVKPLVVMHMPGSEDKDKQLIATKNFLQAFIGCFMGLTIGGGFVKKSFDIIKNNLNLIKVNADDTLSVVKETSEEALEVAKKKLISENTGLAAKFAQAKDMAKSSEGLSKISEFAKGMFKKVKYEPTDDAIAKKAVDVVAHFKANHKDIFAKNIEFVKKIKTDSATGDAFVSFWKNSTGAATSIAKAKVASVFLPIVVGALFGKRAYDKHKKQAQQDVSSTLLNSNTFKKEQEQFAQALNKQNQIAFKGNLLNAGIEKLAVGIENLAMTTGGEKAVKVLSKSKKPSARMADLESALLTCYWVQNTIRSKKIDPDQKLGLNVHTVLVTLVSSTCAFIIDKLFDKPVDIARNTYATEVKKVVNSTVDKLGKSASKEQIFETVKEEAKSLLGTENIAKQISKVGLDDEKMISNAIDKLANNYKGNISKLKSLTVFTLVVRFLVPVLMVPISGKLKKKIIELTSTKKKSLDSCEQPKK